MNGIHFSRILFMENKMTHDCATLRSAKITLNYEFLSINKAFRLFLKFLFNFAFHLAINKVIEQVTVKCYQFS